VEELCGFDCEVCLKRWISEFIKRWSGSLRYSAFGLYQADVVTLIRPTHDVAKEIFLCSIFSSSSPSLPLAFHITVQFSSLTNNPPKTPGPPCKSPILQLAPVIGPPLLSSLRSNCSSRSLIMNLIVVSNEDAALVLLSRPLC
jgi:hypothetical protein